ncbi:MAG: hypothetical protein AB8G99_02410 [Planctomycetaceae bacterium]
MNKAKWAIAIVAVAALPLLGGEGSVTHKGSVHEGRANTRWQSVRNQQSAGEGVARLRRARAGSASTRNQPTTDWIPLNASSGATTSTVSKTTNARWTPKSPRTPVVPEKTKTAIARPTANALPALEAQKETARLDLDAEWPKVRRRSPTLGIAGLRSGKPTSSSPGEFPAVDEGEPWDSTIRPSGVASVRQSRVPASDLDLDADWSKNKAEIKLTTAQSEAGETANRIPAVLPTPTTWEPAERLPNVKHLMNSESNWLGVVQPQPTAHDDLSELLSRNPTFEDDLQGLLDRSPPVSNLVATPVSQSTEPEEKKPRKSECLYTSIDGVFKPLIETVAYDPREDESERPVDCAASLIVGGMVPQHYLTHVTQTPRPNRDVRPFCHNPLYFEDLNLERCGRGYGCATTAVSASRFFGSVALLPYLMTLDHPSKCVQASPDCATCCEFPFEATHPRWSWKAAAVQAGVVTGAFYIIP